MQEIDHWIQFFLFFLFRRLEYTREQLLEFKKQVDEKVGQGHGEEQGGGFGGFGGFGGGSSEVSFNQSNIFLSQFSVLFLFLWEAKDATRADEFACAAASPVIG